MRMFLSRLLRIQLPIWLVMPMLGLVLAIGLGGGYFGTSVVQGAQPLPRGTRDLHQLREFLENLGSRAQRICRSRPPPTRRR